MRSFQYTARCSGGAAMDGVVEAADADAAVETLTGMGLTDVTVTPADRPPAPRAIGADDFIFFNEQLAALADSGMCLDAGLRQLAHDVGSPRLRAVIDAIADDLERGTPLDQAVERHAGAVPPMYASVLRAGVRTGQLSATLLNLSNHMRLMAQTRRIVAQTLAYPAVIGTVAIGIFCLILSFVVPQFQDIFAEFGTRLPGTTLMLFAVSSALPQILTALIVIVALVVIVWVGCGRVESGRAWREAVLRGVPLIGDLITDSIRARLLRGLAFAVHVGIPLPESLRLAAGATGSSTARADAERVASAVEAGTPVAEACRSTPMIPPMCGYVVQVGGDGATLTHALTQLSHAYAARAENRQALIRGWLTPLAVVIVGLFIGLCIVSLFLPLVQLVESVS